MTETTLAPTARRFAEIDPETRYDMLIGGEWVQAESGETFRCVDPYDLGEWGHVPVAGAGDVARAVTAARAAFEGWSRSPAIVRSAILAKWSALILENNESLARLQVHENGKTITEMRGASRSVGMAADFFGHLVLSHHGQTLEPAMPGHEAWTRREPIGVIAAITPWNNPLGLLSWKLFPALAAGNTIVIKPSEVTPVSTLELVRLGVEAGIPAGVVNVVTGAAETGRALVDAPGINKIAFTGSTGAGRAIATSAAPRFVRTTLELGGKGPNIVFDDADLDRAVPGIMTGLMAAAGQACNAGSRILIARSRYDEVIDRLRASIDRMKVGDPLDADTDMGPLASAAQFAKVTGYFDISANEGNPVLTGGTSLQGESGPGYFVAPTLYRTENLRSRIVQEEIFGPVGAVIAFDTEEEAVRIANDVDFGLVAGLWTQSVDRAHRVARRLEAGTVWINTWRAFSNNVPFGGVKSSGIGRELGVGTLDDFTENKSIWLKVAEA